MPEFTEKRCSECGQQLRIPTNIGGMVMVCPSCGNKFHSSFKLATGSRTSQGAMAKLFGMPNDLIKRLLNRIRS